MHAASPTLTSRMRRSATIIVALLVAGAMSAVPVAAQGVYTNTQPVVTAEALLIDPLTAGEIAHLQFGLLLPGGTLEILAASGGVPTVDAGAFEVRTPNRQKSLFIAFQLPASLTHTTKAGVTLPMNWNGAAYAAVCIWTTSCASLVTYNPSLYQYPSPFQYTWTGNQRRNIRVYIGGQIVVPATQAAGDYMGTVTMQYYTTT